MTGTEGRSPENERKGIAIGLTIFALVLIAAVLAYNVLAPAASDSIGLKEEGASSMADASDARIPDLTVNDADGTAVSIRDLEGKPVVLNFWASTCGPCQSEMPHFQAAYEAHGDAVSFIMVDIPGFNGETVERARRFIEDNGYTFPVYFDTEQNASLAFGLTSIPRTYFIGADGTVIAMGSGALSEQTLQQGLEMLGIA